MVQGNYTYIEVSMEHTAGHIILNRPDVHNAFNIEMIREISDAVKTLGSNDQVRFIVISAAGKNFSAGADLQWMKQGQEQSIDVLSAESRELAMLFNDIYHSEKITITLLNGKVMGGANGIVAASDFAIATPGTSFAFSEVRIGLLPATIAPYIVRKTGLQIAYEWMLTGKNFSAGEALQKGLISGIAENEDLSSSAGDLLDKLRRNSPRALKGIKHLFRNEKLTGNPDEMVSTTADLIAAYRASDEAREGINAFFEKRNPGWSDE